MADKEVREVDPQLGATPSSHETCGQFPADEVAATFPHAEQSEADSKSRSKS